ncbi:MAG: hypothetical protein COA92_06295 [Sulfurovum sp.]|nr:MAG: hypothetical protein COA92_06295 [Sulfurovum sp.]
MKTIMMGILLVSTLSFADVIMKKPEKEKPEVSLPIEKPIHPIRPIIRPAILYQDNYYNTNYASSCDSYIQIIVKKDEEMASLAKELELLRSKDQARLQKKLKATHEAELKKFEERKSSVKSENTITISREPVK